MKLLTLLWYSLRSILLRGPIATASILLSERKGDRLYNIQTKGLVIQDKAGAHHYQGASYYVLDKLFRVLSSHGVPDSFFDIGCGLGRVLVVAAHKGYKTCRGIDTNTQLIEKAKNNVAQQNNLNKKIRIETGDASTYIYPQDPQLYFLFNPFNAEVLSKCLKQIESSSAAANYFLYMNPLHKQVFEQLGYGQVAVVKTGYYTEAILYRTRV